MTIDEISLRMSELNAQLRQAISTMERSDKVIYIRNLIKEIQSECPHASDEFQLDKQHKVCPYCGKKF